LAFGGLLLLRSAAGTVSDVVLDDGDLFFVSVDRRLELCL
jgi:hypothetical protein